MLFRLDDTLSIDEEWPRFRPQTPLLAGPTAYVLWWVRIRATTVVLMCLLGLTISVSRVLPQSWFTDTVMLSIFVAGLVVVVLILWCPIKEQAEKSAGYTTLRLAHKELEQRDPYLGRVIRQPGEGYLDHAQFQAIVEAARNEIRVPR